MSNTLIPEAYPYKPKKINMLFCFALFGLGAWFLTYKAQTNDRGLDLVLFRQVIESFSLIEATRIYWGLSIFSVAFSLASLFGLYKAITSKAEVIFTNEAIVVPGGIFSFNKIKTVPFNEILSLEIHKINRVRTLKIIYKKGTVSLNETLLPKKSMLDEICDRLNNQRGVHPTS